VQQKEFSIAEPDGSIGYVGLTLHLS